MSVNAVLVTVRRSNCDQAVTKIIIAGGEHARAAVAREDLPISAGQSPQKPPRPSARQWVELRPTRCYASSVCRGHYHGKKK